MVVGHAVHNDFKVLGYSHPLALTRDTSRIPLLNAKAGLAASECASLKRLTKAVLNRDIQVGAEPMVALCLRATFSSGLAARPCHPGLLVCPQTGKKGHSSVEDARATMELYRVVEAEWEKQLASKAQSAWCQK